MREIKFRGHNGIEWLYDSQISIISYDKNACYFMPNKKNKSEQDDIYNWDNVSYVGEYTGIKDYKGKEIYEGDIVEKEFMKPWVEEKIIGVVKMIDGCWSVVNDKKKIVEYLWDGVNFNHVIGNIYEDSNLLEGND